MFKKETGKEGTEVYKGIIARAESPMLPDAIIHQIILTDSE